MHTFVDLKFSCAREKSRRTKRNQKKKNNKILHSFHILLELIYIELGSFHNQRFNISSDKSSSVMVPKWGESNIGPAGTLCRFWRLNGPHHNVPRQHM